MKHMQLIAGMLVFLTLFVSAIGFAADEDLERLIESGNAAYERLDYDKALDIYDGGLEAAPKEPILLYNKGNVLFQQKKYAEAIGVYQLAIAQKPRQLLLKNIFYNAGNAYYQLAAQKEESAETLEDLQAVLTTYENAFGMYRKSLDLERKIGISMGYDIDKAGISVRQNWALAREAWMGVWDKIRALQKKDLKLEDGIRQILEAQKTLYPKLESIYLTSFSEDALKFNLKTLAQFQLDFKEDIQYLRELAQKDIERLTAEISNHQTAQKQPPAQGKPLQGQPATDPELEKLTAQKKDSEKILEAVNQTIGLEEWIVDGFNRGEVLESMTNSRKMIDVLTALLHYLAQTDPVPEAYQGLLQDLSATFALLAKAAEFPPTKEKDVYKDIGLRMRVLSGFKLNTAVQTLARNTTYMNLLQKKIEEQHLKTPPANKQNQTPLTRFMAETHIKIMSASVGDVIQRNQEIETTLKDAAAPLQKGEAVDLNAQKTLEAVATVLDRYLNIQKSIPELFSQLIEQSEAVLDALDQTVESPPDPLKNPHTKALALSVVLRYKYRLFADEAAKTTDDALADLRKQLPAQRQSLESAWNDFAIQRAQEWQSAKDIVRLKEAVTTYRKALLQNLLFLAPDLAIAHYYRRTLDRQDQVLALLPTTSANKSTVKAALSRSTPEIKLLNSLLVQYVQQASAALANLTDEEQISALKKTIAAKGNAQLLMARAESGAKDATNFLDADQFMKTDFVLRDMRSLIEKSQLTFLEQPNAPIPSVEQAIKWQNSLQEQGRTATSIESEEGASRKIAPYTTGNQSDVMRITTEAIAQIRKELEKATKEAPQNPTQGLPQPSPQQPSAAPAPPEKMKEAITHLQDALLEAEKSRAFLEAAEFSNADQKHEPIIEHLTKALEALKNKQDQNNGDSKDKKQGQKEQQQQNQNQNQDQNQKGQSGQQRPQPSSPLELTPEQARDLLNQLNKSDERSSKKKDEGKGIINTPRPW